MSTNKGESPIAFLIIVLILAGYALWIKKNNPTMPVVNEINTETTITTTRDSGIKVSPNANVYVPLDMNNYSNALMVYKNYRIQLGENCRATPSNITYKNNTDIMLDNRSSVDRTINIGTNFTIVKAGSFKIIKLSSPILPMTFFVKCDQFQNVAAILIQK